MKKLLAFVCIFAMFLTCCACRDSEPETSTYTYYEDGDSGNGNAGKKSDGDSGDNMSEQTNKPVENPLKADLKGATIVIYAVDNTFTPDSKASKTDAAKAKIIEQLQKDLNCKFAVTKTDVDKLQKLAAASAASGKAIANIISTDISRLGYFITSNLVADMGKISSVDLSKDYMNAAGLPEATRFGNGRYAVAADATVGSGIVYNKRILKELGYGDNYLYDLVDQGKWTYSEYRRLSKQATKDLDGKPGMSGEDQWGNVVMDRDTGATVDLLVSANTPMIKLSDGKLVSNMSSPNIAKVANLMRDTYITDGTNYRLNGSSVTGKKAHEAFKSGKVFMEYTTTDVMSTYSTMKDEFGFIPTPKFDGANSYSCALDWNYKGIMIPAGQSATDQYNAGVVVQAYMYLMKDIYKTKRNEFVNRYFCDTKSGENFDLVVKGVTVHPAQCYAKMNETVLTGTYRVFWNYISRGVSVSSSIESTSSSLNKALSDWNTKIKDK